MTCVTLGMEEKIRIFKGDVEYVHTSVIIPKQLREKAKQMKIHMSEALIDGITLHFKKAHNEPMENLHETDKQK